MPAERIVKPWGLYDYPFAEEGTHPVLIISNGLRCANSAFEHLNGLFCRSIRPQFQPKDFHVVLDEADGLDHGTVVRCDYIYALRRDLIGTHHGIVIRARRSAIFRKVMQWFEWPPA